MSNRDLIKRVMAKTATVQKTAAFPPFAENGPPQPPEEDGGGGNSPVGGKRNIPKDHPYDPKALKPMATALWAASVSLGHALTAYRHLSRLKSATISPDGMLGGRGYVMGVPDVRKKLYAACEALSAITDTLHDEITAPHWRPKLALLDETDAEEIEQYLEKSQGILDDPEAEVEEEEEEIEGGKDKPEKEPEEASSMPDGGSGNETSQAVPMMRPKEASFNPYDRTANSSVSPGALGGPRVEHLDREDQPDPEMAYDGWGYPSMIEHQESENGEGNLSDRGAGSGMPGAVTDTTPTEAYDFGLGYGANGQGAGGYGNPSGEGNGTKGVFGPTSGLPGGGSGSSGDTTPEFNAEVSDRHSMDSLPNDDQPPVARSDYYQGDKGNMVNDSGPMAQSEMPAEPTPGGEMSPSMMNTDYTYTDMETPYVRYDYTTPNYRPDPLHNWPEKQQTG